MNILPKSSQLEFIKIRSKKLEYYLKSNKSVSGLLLNSSHSSPTLTEITNSQLDTQVLFWGEDDEYDKDTVGDGYYDMLVYSPSNISQPNQVIVANKIISRLLQETGSETSLFFSKYEMDENFNAIKGLKWWEILLIILGILLLLLIIFLLICCCCCCCCGKKKQKKTEKVYDVTYIKKNERKQIKPVHSEPDNRIKNVQVKTYSDYNNSVYEDGFYPPVNYKGGDSTVNNYINDNSFKNRGL